MDQGVLVTEEHSNVKFNFNNENYVIKKEYLDKADIHKSIDIFDEVASVLDIKKL
jgi:phosphorylcholine metabolism protein LicD